MSTTTIVNNEKSNSEWYHNLGTAIWYVVFIIIIPVGIRFTKSFSFLRYYFPIVDLIANVFSSSGHKQLHIFKDLYNLTPNNPISFLSTNFINLIALIGVSWNGILHAIQKNDVWKGITVTVFMYVITYLLPTQGISYFINKAQKVIDKWLNIDYNDKTRFRWEAYLGGFLFVIVLVLIEFICIKLYLKSLK